MLDATLSPKNQYPLASTLVVQITDDVFVCAIARKLLRDGADPTARLEAMRGDVLAIAGPISVFADLCVEDSPTGRPRFRKYRPARLGRIAQDRANGRGMADAPSPAIAKAEALAARPRTEQNGAGARTLKKILADIGVTVAPAGRRRAPADGGSS